MKGIIMRLVLICVATRVSAASDQAIAQAVQAVLDTMPTGGAMVLAAEEDVSICESTITLQSSRRDWRQAKVVRFFRVFPAQYDIRMDRVVAAQVHLDSDPEWIVAIWPESAIAVLAGLADEEANESFNRLIKYLDLRIETGEDALNVFDYWLLVARGQRVRKTVVTDRLGALSVAAEMLRLKYGGKIGFAEFQKWQQSQAANLAALRAPVSRVAQGSAMVRFWEVRDAGLAAASVTFSLDGRVNELSRKLERGQPIRHNRAQKHVVR